MKKEINKYRVVAFLYAFYAIAHFVIIATVLSILGWHGFDQFIEDLKLVFFSVAPLGILAAVNIIMAILSLGFLNHSKVKKRITVGVALLLVALPTFGLLSTIANERNTYSQLISFGFIVIYSVPACSLTKGMISNRKQKG